MQAMRKLLCRTSIVCLLPMLAGIGTIVKAQGRMTIQATANGTSTQMGKIANVNIYIEQYSTVEDRNSLINAFKKSGQDGMVKVLEDMKPKGRIRFASGGVGNDIKYIIELPSQKGRPSGREPSLICEPCQLVRASFLSAIAIVLLAQADGGSLDSTMALVAARIPPEPFVIASLAPGTWWLPPPRPVSSASPRNCSAASTMWCIAPRWA